jgi:hypothetical protein
VKQTIGIPTYPYGLAEKVVREAQADVYGGFVAVHPTFWGPPEAPVKGKQGWRNWSVTFIPEGTLVAAFLYQRTAKRFAEAVLELFVSEMDDGVWAQDMKQPLVALAMRHMQEEARG